jgi:hypothetical protein
MRQVVEGNIHRLPHPHHYPEQVTIVRAAHPFEGKSLTLLGHTHRKNRLHLLLILPDGSKSLVPAEWTNLNSTPERTVDQPTATLASFNELLRMRTVVDALQRRLASVTGEAAKPNTDEESNGAKATQLSGTSFPGDSCSRSAKATFHRNLTVLHVEQLCTLIAVKYLPGAKKLSFVNGGGEPCTNLTAYWNSLHGRGLYSRRSGTGRGGGGSLTAGAGGAGDLGRFFAAFEAEWRFVVVMVQVLRY